MLRRTLFCFVDVVNFFISLFLFSASSSVRSSPNRTFPTGHIPPDISPSDKSPWAFPPSDFPWRRQWLKWGGFGGGLSPPPPASTWAPPARIWAPPANAGPMLLSSTKSRKKCSYMVKVMLTKMLWVSAVNITAGSHFSIRLIIWKVL